MGGISVLLLQGIFLILGILIFFSIVGLIILIIGTIINFVSLKKKKKKSIPAIISIVIGTILMIPMIYYLIWTGVSTLNKERLHKEELGELAYSVEIEDIKKLDTLLANGENPNLDASKVIPLEIAIKKGNLVIMRKLLDAGANPNAISKNGDTLLLKALEYVTSQTGSNYIDRAKLLIEYRADVTARTEGNIISGSTSLILLAEHSNPDSVAKDEEVVLLASIFLEKGVDINAQNSSGETALIHACKSGSKYLKPNIQLIKFLIQNGANKDITDNWNEGRKAIYYFKEHYESSDNKLIKDEEYYEILLMLE